MPDSPLDASLAGALGGRTATALQKAFGLRTVGDLLAHFPRRYARRGELTALDQLPLGESVTIVAQVLDVRERTMRARRGSILEVRIGDGQGILTLTFFNQAWRAKDLVPGARGIFAGKVGDYRGLRQLAHPDYELFDASHEAVAGVGDQQAQKWAKQPIPIYPASASVASWQVQKSVEVLLDGLPPIDDAVPASVRSELDLVPVSEAYERIHRPETDRDHLTARDTLRFDEAFVLQSALLQQRALVRRSAATPRRATPDGLLATFDAALPFERTGDQRLVGDEITRDLEAEVPMNRLVQGEVGSGKTLVALRAMLAVAESGGQSALLAPTEVLAAQHLRSITATLGPDLAARLRPTLLTGQMTVAQRKKALLSIVSGQAHIVVGTHALISETVEFFDLGLVVVDEQHRFGVDQREALRKKGATPPHVLVLTATPIPRTVAMTVFGDLDVSTIAELPKGRQPIESFVVPLADHPTWGGRIWQRSAEEVAKGRQVFVVCPAIDAVTAEPGDPPDADDAPGDDAPGADASEAPAPERASVEGVMARVPTIPVLQGLRVEPLHGRMSSDEKDDVMRRFAAGDIDVLVATTVIEVGVDVPNASTMVVLDADRFGVSQLHQLRGRVGRGGHPGLCLLVTHAAADTVARERVDAVAATLDGFELAQVDLDLRREGDVLGNLQSGGRSSLRLLRVARDGDLIGLAREHAAGVLDADPRLVDHPALAAAIARRLDDRGREAMGKN
ncbi:MULTISPECIES: ATP-dependent DNA helicase RecG [unclassified Frigoribacterium]|uniref:ATP-dependent DNA helicase RecG n=1 Tax=unclassified Frigoribacterium TaxID=2627005 RepID=UPI0007001496|nr:MULTISPECIES: ATP-dependent DNA helicase RecG [unclassified Frigoribacterium]KQO48466.1 ATP-dependent DNA helicase RecG [Frigoribacterium sp. Leaf254]KQT40678.1 ATP-dependent DNA helicase RecG [Frigoribacterium sp. Leaf415]